MTKCTKCGVLKEGSEFHKNSARKNGVASHCKACCHNYHKRTYIPLKPPADRAVKICTKCGLEKNKSEFSRLGSAPPRSLKLKARCKTCSSEDQSQRYWSDPEKSRARDRKYYWDDPEKARVKDRERYWKDPEKARARITGQYWADPEKARAKRRELRRKDPEKIRARHRGYYWEDPEKARAAQRNRCASDPGYKLSRNLRSRIYNALKQAGTSKSKATKELIGCPVARLKAHLESLFKSGMTWENHGPVWHIDHIKPCDAFDLTDLEQQKICFHWSNQQPLFAAENLSKGAKYRG